MKVFLVEDSPLVLRRLEALVASVPGATVAGHADTAQAAVAGILAGLPDVVLLDIRLAGGTGYEVLREVRSRAPQVDCYMLSSHATAPYRRLAAECGAADFFDKSTEFERVRETLARRAATNELH